MFYVILAALAPVLVALWYIYRKDSAQPEPRNWLVKAFFYGVGSAFLSFVFSTPASEIFHLQVAPGVYPNILTAFADAFLLAAIPEELAKLIMLWLVLRKNPYFDEKFDGIVYAVCVGMGFAGLENILYLVGGVEDGSWVATGISRALFSIPGHFLFAVLMGYYYSLYHFGVKRGPLAAAMVLVAPVVAHGVFDGILFSMQVNEFLSSIGMLVFLYFLNELRKKGKERIERLVNQ